MTASESSLVMKTMSDIMRDTSEPWALVNCHGNSSNHGIGNDDNGVELHETDCSSSSEEGMSASAHTTDLGDASTDATNITDLNPDDENIENGKNNARETAIGHILSLPWPDVPSHSRTPLPYDRELNIEDEEGTNTGNLSSSTKIHGSAIIAAHNKHKCVTQPHGCAAVRVGWDSRIPRWCKGSELGYVVCGESFPTEDSVILAENAMRRATSDWKSIGASFKQVERHEAATFAVIYDNSQEDNTYAYSFFPKASPGKLLICPLSFSGGNDQYLANILTHEVGHILGLRHEIAHIKEPQCPSVLFGSEDPQSVMNYKDLSELKVSEQDLEGLKEVYAYDQPVYKGLSVIDISPNLYTFSGAAVPVMQQRN